MRHGLQRQTLMCASVIKCDLVSGIPPPAKLWGCFFELVPPFPSARGRKKKSSSTDSGPSAPPLRPRDSAPKEHPTRRMMARWATSDGPCDSLFQMKKKKINIFDKTTRVSAIRGSAYVMLLGVFVIRIHIPELRGLRSRSAGGRRILNGA